MRDDFKECYNFGGQFAQTYTERCKCGAYSQISTQTDECPEYYTTVFVRCGNCGRSVRFMLPVN